MKSGIYKIKNLTNGKEYIGGSLYIRKRLNSHFSKLGRNKHGNKQLQLDYNSGHSFVYGVVEFCHRDILCTLENNYIEVDNKNTYNKCFSRPSDFETPFDPCEEFYIGNYLGERLLRFNSKAEARRILGYSTAKTLCRKNMINGRRLRNNEFLFTSLTAAPDDIYFVFDKSTGNFLQSFWNKESVCVFIKRDTFNLDTRMGGCDYIVSTDVNYSTPTETRGKGNSLRVALYDLNLEVVKIFSSLQECALFIGGRNTQTTYRFHGYVRKWHKGKHTKRVTRFYKGYYIAPPDLDIKQWVKELEFNNHVKRRAAMQKL